MADNSGFESAFGCLVMIIGVYVLITVVIPFLVGAGALAWFWIMLQTSR